MGKKESKHDNLCVGIDLGTTNSVLATINEKLNGEIVSKVVDIRRAVDMYGAVSGETKLTRTKKPTLPSCVYFRQELNYEPLVGDFAKMQYPLRPHLVARSIKSQMGYAEASGLSPDIPDRNPARISSEILKHMLREVSEIYRCDITDAVITVPANFDSVMCKATLDAAELAGIKVRNSDGTERPVLLSEPNAVIYDLINQIHNGEISSRILDLSEKRRVLVFDLGGGTLDITIHEIQRREGMEQVLKVDEIATNRYTLLGGDDFDEEIAKAMYGRYLKQYSNHPDVVRKLRQKENMIMPQLRVYAEHLKLDLNERYEEGYSSRWDDEDDEEILLTAGGNMGGIGYSYDDTFTREEVEKILERFMAYDLTFDDYKRIEDISDTRNIIYPILDVLCKASEKWRGEAAVDAVIVNGGMSKFYMVTERLKEFFGMEPIVALDPDQAVARGAAVYHYYLHKYDEMQDDMKLLGQAVPVSGHQAEAKPGIWKPVKELKPLEARPKPAQGMEIQWGKPILNDSLYLGVKNGAVHQIIPTGTQLPYLSSVMTGFRVEPGQNRIAIPVKSRNLDGSYRTIANGNISFKKGYKDGAFVAFEISMGSNKVITMKAWTSRDQDGKHKLEEGYVEISIDSRESVKMKRKFMAPLGSVLDPKAEINNLIQLCQNHDRSRDTMERGATAKRISAAIDSICSADNKEQFAEVILDRFGEVTGEETRMRMFIIARRIGHIWTDSQKRKLARVCMNQINPVLHGLSAYGPRISTNIQAIYTLSICGETSQLASLSEIHKAAPYLQACLYVHGKTRTEIRWLQEELEKDIRKITKNQASNIQFSAHAIGIALRKDGTMENPGSPKIDEKITGRLCDAIRTGKLGKEELTSCILALGCICDQRMQVCEMKTGIFREALGMIEKLGDFCDILNVMACQKAREVAVKMMNGEALSGEEERFLLVKLEG